MTLQDIDARNARPKDKSCKLGDTNGLYILLVFPNCSRYWRLNYRYDGKEKKYAIGVYPDVSLKEARSEARTACK